MSALGWHRHNLGGLKIIILSTCKIYFMQSSLCGVMSFSFALLYQSNGEVTELKSKIKSD